MRAAEQAELMGAREAESILEISRASLHRLATSGRLKGTLLDKRGRGRAWRFKRSDVMKLKHEGTALKRGPVRQRIRAAWCNWYGTIPAGLTVFACDGNRDNLTPRNLALAPLAARIEKAERRTPKAVATRSHVWTAEDLRTLKRAFATRPTIELARHFGVTAQAVRCQARRMKLRKQLEHVREQARAARALPIGTERIDPTCDIVVIKVSMKGRQTEQWRRKHHVIWEQANGRTVPPGWRVAFKDGDKRNFQPANLELRSRDEISARAFANYYAYPPELRAVIKLHSALQHDIQRRLSGASEPVASSTPERKRGKQRRWSPEMDEVLRLHYANGSLDELRTTLLTSLQSIRLRARRLGLRRSPEAYVAQARAKAELEKARLFATGG